MPFGDSTSTSKASPSSTRFCNWPTVPLSTTTLWPVAFSNSGTKATTTCLNAPVVSTLISAAAAGCVMTPTIPNTAPSRSPMLRFMVSPPMNGHLAADNEGLRGVELGLVHPFFQRHHVWNLAIACCPHIDDPVLASGFLGQHRSVVRRLPDQKVAAIFRIGDRVVP